MLSTLLPNVVVEAVDQMIAMEEIMKQTMTNVFSQIAQARQQAHAAAQEEISRLQVEMLLHRCCLTVFTRASMTMFRRSSSR